MHRLVVEGAAAIRRESVEWRAMFFDVIFLPYTAAGALGARARDREVTQSGIDELRCLL